LLIPVALGVALLTGGVIGVVIGLRGTLKAVERAFSGNSSERADFLETALRRRKLELGEKVVAIRRRHRAFDDAARFERVLKQYHRRGDDGR
jgi:hypothetical protein